MASWLEPAERNITTRAYWSRCGGDASIPGSVGADHDQVHGQACGYLLDAWSQAPSPSETWSPPPLKEFQGVFTVMADWTEELTTTTPANSAKTYFGIQGDVTLLPRFTDQNAGLVTLWRNHVGVLLAERLLTTCP